MFCLFCGSSQGSSPSRPGLVASVVCLQSCPDFLIHDTRPQSCIYLPVQAVCRKRYRRMHAAIRLSLQGMQLRFRVAGARIDRLRVPRVRECRSIETGVANGVSGQDQRDDRPQPRSGRPRGSLQQLRAIGTAPAQMTGMRPCTESRCGFVVFTTKPNITVGPAP